MIDPRAMITPTRRAPIPPRVPVPAPVPAAPRPPGGLGALRRGVPAPQPEEEPETARPRPREIGTPSVSAGSPAGLRAPPCTPMGRSTGGSRLPTRRTTTSPGDHLRCLGARRRGATPPQPTQLIRNTEMRIAKTDDIINRFIMDIYDAGRKIGGLEVELGTNGHVMYDHSRVVPGALKRLAQAGFEIVRKGEPAKAPSTAGDILRNALHEANELGRAPSPENGSITAPPRRPWSTSLHRPASRSPRSSPGRSSTARMRIAGRSASATSSPISMGPRTRSRSMISWKRSGPSGISLRARQSRPSLRARSTKLPRASLPRPRHPQPLSLWRPMAGASTTPS